MLKIGKVAVLNQLRYLRARGPFDRIFFDISELTVTDGHIQNKLSDNQF